MIRSELRKARERIEYEEKVRERKKKEEELIIGSEIRDTMKA